MPESAAHCFERLRLAALDEQHKFEVKRLTNDAIMKGKEADECEKLKTHCAGFEIPDDQVSFVEGEVAKIGQILWQGGRDKATDELVNAIRGFGASSAMQNAAEGG